MKKELRWITHATMCFVVFSCGRIFAANDSACMAKDVVITPTGIAALEAGQINHGYTKPISASLITPLEHVWQQDAWVLFGYDVMIKQKLHLNFVGGGTITFSTPQITNLPVTMQSHYNFYIDHAYADYSLGNTNNLFLKFQLGLFPYKYNPDVRNLGEYLFRTLAYPLVVYSDFDKPWANLLGARVNFQFHDKLLENDLLLHSNINTMPVQDWSISDVLSSTVAKGAVTLGAGISLNNFLSVYQGQYAPGQGWADPFYYPQNLDLKDKNYLRVINGTDTAYLDWKSVRLMGRISIDPKPFIPLKIFGENDLKLYAEVDAIGLQNYPFRDTTLGIGYDSLGDRVFYDFGFNFPGFKIVDLINMEFEYCANRSAFSEEKIYGQTSVQLLPTSLSSYQPLLNRALWRWSIYLKKSFFDGHFSLITQVARDHKKINFYYFDPKYMSFMEALPTVHDWWWTFKTEFKF